MLFRSQYKEIEGSGGCYGRVDEFTGQAVAKSLLSVFKDQEGTMNKNIQNLEFIKNYANKIIETNKISALYGQMLR